jgi:HEAT repeat protein
MHSWEGDPHPQGKPEFGSVGPSSDLQRPDRSIDPEAGSWRILFAVIAGIFLALIFVSGSARATFTELAQFLSLRGKPKPASPAIISQHELERLDRQSPQAQAQLLLERSINHYDGANDQIAVRVENWRGHLKLNQNLNSLITTALNANDLRVRAAAIEVDLAALGVAKKTETVQQLSEQAESGPQNERVWALWELGLLGNRGVDPERATQVLVSQLQDSNPEIRHWAVEGLAYLGTSQTIEPLLRTFHDDPSPMVRERAACSLGQSGMLSQDQRRSVVPQLLGFAEDPSLDPQTHGWVYQALRDITGQALPADPIAWRSWYSSKGTS